MSEHTNESVAIIGLGLVGGSVARALVVRGVRVRGAADSADDRRQAAQIGVEVADVRGVAAGERPPAVVLIAAPLGAVAQIADELLPHLPPETVVLHAAGLQGRRATGLSDAARSRVIGTHPMAGSHDAGFSASRADLFGDAAVFAEARAGEAVRARIEWLWRMAGAARVEYRAAEVHDATMAWVSHLPQLASTALAAALARGGVPASAGGPGLRDTTRLAASPLAIWRDVLRSAPPETADALATLGEIVDQMRAALAGQEEGELAAIWKGARDWRRAEGPAGGTVPAPGPRSPDGEGRRRVAAATGRGSRW